MGHSFISHGKSSIRLHDADITVAIYILHETVHNCTELENSFYGIISEWLEDVKGAPPGMVCLEFSEFQDTAALIELIIMALDKTHGFGDSIPKSFLNSKANSVRDVFSDDFPSERVIRTLKSMKNLLEHE